MGGLGELEPTSVEVAVHPGPDMRAYVDGDGGQVPILMITAPGLDVMVSPSGAVTAADLAGAEQIAAAAADYRDRLRELAPPIEEENRS